MLWHRSHVFQDLWSLIRGLQLSGQLCQSFVGLSIGVSMYLNIHYLTESYFKELEGHTYQWAFSVHFWGVVFSYITRFIKEVESSEEMVWDSISRERVQIPNLLLNGNFLPQWKGKTVRTGALTPFCHLP